MERLTPDSEIGQIAERLHETNSRLSLWLSSLTAEPQPAAAPTPQFMTNLLSELAQTSAMLQSLTDQHRSFLEKELSEYRNSLERLRNLLPAVHDALLEQRADLEKERSRLEAAAAWARRSRQTL